MKKNLLIVFFLLSSYLSFSKANFENGYIIDDKGVKTECLIDNGYWQSTPQKISYKIGEEIKTAELKSIASFEIYNYGKFEKHVVKVAKNQYELEDPNFIWQNDTLILEVLIQGNPSLYAYSVSNNHMFFYQTKDDSIPVQLKYKEVRNESEIQKNKSFRNQLTHLAGDCKGLSFYTISRIEYSDDDLKFAFERINKCKNAHFETYKRQKKTLFYFSLSASAGLTNNNLNITGLNNFYSGTFDDHSTNKMGYRIGAALEFRSPVYFQNWSVLFEPVFQSFDNSRVIRGENVWIYKRQEVELNFGLRRYFKVSDRFKLFADATVNVKNVYFGSSLKYNYIYPVSKIEVPLYDMDIRSIQPLANSITIGAGFHYGRLGFAAKYNIPHNIATLNQDMWKIKLSSLQAIAIVRLF